MRSTPLGCRTTNTFTNGNGELGVGGSTACNRRCDNLLATLPLFELACVLVRRDHVASFIVNAGDGVMWTGRKIRLPSRYSFPEVPALGGRPPGLCESDGSRPELGD